MFTAVVHQQGNSCSRPVPPLRTRGKFKFYSTTISSPVHINQLKKKQMSDESKGPVV